MQYIAKQRSEPELWATWFIDNNGDRNYDFRAFPYLEDAKKYLIDEQYGLCAYCQQEITLKNSLIEHVIPYGQSPLISTSYHNLVAACNNQIPDDKNKKHCDKSRGSILLPPIIFHKDFTLPDGDCYEYFESEDNGTLKPRAFEWGKMEWNIHMQVTAFIEILNLNHINLRKKRSDRLRELEENIHLMTRKQAMRYWRDMYNDIIADVSFPFRQFFLIYLKNKLSPT